MNDRSARILLVDDEQSIQALLSYPLRKEGYDVVQATDGRQALDRFEEQPFDLVVLDLMLPKIDGLDVLQRLRADPRTKRLPVVVLTSSREEQDLIESYDLGANSYVRKPVDFARFAEAVQQLQMYWLVLNEAPPSGD